MYPVKFLPVKDILSKIGAAPSYIKSRPEHQYIIFTFRTFLIFVSFNFVTLTVKSIDKLIIFVLHLRFLFELLFILLIL